MDNDNDDDPVVVPPTGPTGAPADTTSVVAVALGDPQFTSLVEALVGAELVDTLRGPGPFTVFAPTNEAFLRAGIDFAALPLETRQAILTLHVVSGNLNAAAVTMSSQLASLEGSSLQVASRNGGVYLNGLTRITQTDLAASNGVIHVIDSVLLPDAVLATLTVTDVVSAYPSLGALRDAVVKASLADTLADPAGTFTVFAPDSAAFSALLEALGASSLDDVSAAQLTPILLYHVLGSEQLAAAVVAASSFTALGGDIAVAVADGTVSLDARADVVFTDIETANGVIHVIDQVLLPSLKDIVATRPEFSSLLAATIKADTADPSPGLVTALDNDAASLTVFAPSNAGFDVFAGAVAATGATALVAATDAETLAAIVTGHVVPDAKLAATGVVGATGPLASLAGPASLTVATRAGGVRINGLSKITATDLIASNGYLHTLDSVIMPADFRETLRLSQLFSAYPEYSLLVDAVVKADLVEALDNDAGTVFAPDNAAFAALLDSLGISNGLDGLSAAQLTPILKYHLLATRVTADAMANPVISLGGSLVALSFESGLISLDDINTFAVDITGGNVEPAAYVVHLVEGVLLPSLLDIAAYDSAFSSLAAAVAKITTNGGATGPIADIGNSVRNTLDDNTASLTLFAPSNDAFVALLGQLAPSGTTGIDELADFSAGQLLPILRYHVLGSRVDAADAIAASGTDVTTLGGNFALTGPTGPSGLLRIDDRAYVTATDIIAKNGVLHVIDAVLLPSITDVVTTDERFTQLASLVASADGAPGTEPKIGAALDGEGGFTLFAPSNDSIGNFVEAVGAENIPFGQGLTNVLLYHALDDVAYASSLPDDPTDVATLLGAPVTLQAPNSITGGASGAQAMSIIEVNLFTANGVIHVIEGAGEDGVLRPGPL